jgi:hypothetical protein
VTSCVRGAWDEGRRRRPQYPSKSERFREVIGRWRLMAVLAGAALYATAARDTGRVIPEESATPNLVEVVTDVDGILDVAGASGVRGQLKTGQARLRTAQSRLRPSSISVTASSIPSFARRAVRRVAPASSPKGPR